jgi:Kef-type K+ transport system membrane component KefB
VLARILDERGISKTNLGSTAISCAAVDDVTAWSILAFIVVLSRAGSMVSIIVDLVLVIAFVAFMLLIVRPLLPGWFSTGENGEKLNKNTLVGVLLVFLASALTTEILGIHALFGIGDRLAGLDLILLGGKHQLNDSTDGLVVVHH